MLYCEDHGGGCCGRKHIYEFDHSLPNSGEHARLKELLREVVNTQFYEEDADDYVDEDIFQLQNYCVEITLTHYQATTVPFKSVFNSDVDLLNPKFINKTWDQVLREDFGFKRVFAFRNPNTENYVYVYLLSLNEVNNIL